MPTRPIRRILTLFAFALASETIGFTQSATTVKPIVIHGRNSSWQVAQAVGVSIHKFVVVTIDQPNRRQACGVESSTADKLVCARVIGGPRTYFPNQVIALIVPGDGALRLPIWLGLNAGLGAAIWATIVLAATCPACAAATAVAALFLFGGAGATAYADDVPDRLLYVAPGKALSRKLGFIQPWP